MAKVKVGRNKYNGMWEVILFDSLRTSIGEVGRMSFDSQELIALSEAVKEAVKEQATGEWVIYDRKNLDQVEKLHYLDPDFLSEV